jgi:hypothetical protein
MVRRSGIATPPRSQLGDAQQFLEVFMILLCGESGQPWVLAAVDWNGLGSSPQHSNKE